MKYNKIFSLLSFALLLSMAHNSFCNEEFQIIRKLNLNKFGHKAISPCGNFIALGDRKGKVIIWDIKNNKEICSYSHKKPITCLRFGKNGKYIASGSKDGEFILYDIRKNKSTFSCKHNGQIRGIYFNKNENNENDVRSWSEEQVVVYDIDKQKITRTHTCENRDDIIRYVYGDNVRIESNSEGVQDIEERSYSLITSLCYNENNEDKANKNYMAVGFADGTIEIHDSHESQENIIACYKHENRITRICFAPDGSYVASSDDYGTVTIYDIEKKKIIYSYEHENNNRARSLCFANNHETFVSVSSMGQIMIHETSEKFKQAQEYYDNLKTFGISIDKDAEYGDDLEARFQFLPELLS